MNPWLCNPRSNPDGKEILNDFHSIIGNVARQVIHWLPLVASTSTSERTRINFCFVPTHILSLMRLFLSFFIPPLLDQHGCSRSDKWSDLRINSLEKCSNVLYNCGNYWTSWVVNGRKCSLRRMMRIIRRGRENINASVTEKRKESEGEGGLLMV